MLSCNYKNDLRKRRRRSRGTGGRGINRRRGGRVG
jgi:hypothetical protein